MNRLILRTFSIAPLFLCATAWTTSHFYGLNIQCFDAEKRFVEIVSGRIHIGKRDPCTLFEYGVPVRTGCQITRYPTNPAIASAMAASYGWKYHLGGFLQNGAQKWIIIPFWIPMSLTLIPLCCTWRKTSKKLNTPAFPVNASTPRLNRASLTGSFSSQKVTLFISFLFFVN